MHIKTHNPKSRCGNLSNTYTKPPKFSVPWSFRRFHVCNLTMVWVRPTPVATFSLLIIACVGIVSSIVKTTVRKANTKYRSWSRVLTLVPITRLYVQCLSVVSLFEYLTHCFVFPNASCLQKHVLQGRYQKRGKEERDKPLAAVKLLTASSYRVGGFSIASADLDHSRASVMLLVPIVPVFILCLLYTSPSPRD